MTPNEITAAARAKFGEPNSRLSTAHELRFGNRGSIAVVLTGEKAGLWYTHEGAYGGSLRNDDDDHTAHRPLPTRKPPLKYGTDSSERCQRLVDQSRTIRPGSPADLYLRSRGATEWPDMSIRETPAGVLYVARDINAQYLAAQMVPLTQDGCKNPRYWSDGITKRTYTIADGWSTFSAVRFPGKGAPVLCEGVETALSVWHATGRQTYACLGQAGLRNFRVRGERITIARDGDETDSPADKSIKNTISARTARNQVVRVAMPPIGKDFNNVHLEQGLPVVAEYIKNAVVMK